MADKKVAEQYFRPPKLSCWESFKQFLWNGETSAFMGRTAGSWAKIVLFLVLFNAALAAFFAALFTIFWQTLDPDKPKRQLENGLIGSNPGLAFRPMPPDARPDRTRIWYKASDPANSDHLFKSVNTFLEDYKKTPNLENQIHCDHNTQQQDGQVCIFSADSLGNCSPEKTKGEYGYPERRPCVFLKLNKIYNWMPVVYNTTENLPAGMPQSIKQAIGGDQLKDKNLIWISCEGESPADEENLSDINYFPHRGFPDYYFPYKNWQGYLPPLVAVQFDYPKSGVQINIECKAWAKNIHHDRVDRRGSFHFGLLID